jgi:ubiquinone/menaquinone biosynthesis C-methylase UbiE
MRVLDVGAGYSRLPIHIAERFGCEVWAVDDFGRLDKDEFWERNQDPYVHITQHPEVKYVVGRIGTKSTEDIPLKYFDVIYSASALEHVSPEDVPAVWHHLDRLLKPKGCMLHAVDLAFPTSRGLKHVLLAVLFDMLYPVLPGAIRRKFLYETPKSFVRFISSELGLSRDQGQESLGVVTMVINPEIVTEPLEHTFNRMRKDGQINARHYRVASLVLKLLKIE